uniref:Uncharacterized protein n=1 Tax=Cacopsylla melanoneura TaxID=428564 RepID=A0A8D8ZHI0_9HEMI
MSSVVWWTTIVPVIMRGSVVTRGRTSIHMSVRRWTTPVIDRTSVVKTKWWRSSVVYVGASLINVRRWASVIQGWWTSIVHEWRTSVVHGWRSPIVHVWRPPIVHRWWPPVVHVWRSPIVHRWWTIPIQVWLAPVHIIIIEPLSWWWIIIEVAGAC